MKTNKFTFSILILFLSFSTFSSTRRYRLTYRNDPATTIAIAWEQNGGSGAMVYYDTIDHGTNWSAYSFSHGVDRSTSTKGMDHKFARLMGLIPETAYYFVIKDSDGTSSRFWFKTLSNDPNIPLSIIAGGDCRTNLGARRNANKMVSKLRPDFVYFGGDFTDIGSNIEWATWFDDWQLTTSNDGRMFPIVAARGNHEWNNANIYEMFDSPNSDVYFALSFGGNLLRAYTLNSEMSIPGAQTNWLINDLISNHNAFEWKIAQYHRPMRPHNSGKSEGNDQYNNWAQAFYDYGVRLIVECDAHTVKSTWKLQPSTATGSDEGFIREDSKGSVFIGEGCWGAPLRADNDTKNWTRNSGVFNHFNWIKVTKQQIEVKYVQTDNADSVNSVNDNARFIEPNNLSIWNPSNGRSVIIDNDKYLGRPSVDITYPNNGDGFSSPQLVSILANAQDTNGTVDYVEFFVNDIPIGIDSSAPYSMNWNMPANGSYVLTAWAVDNDGYHNISDDVHVFVGNVDITSQVSSSSDDAEENTSNNYVDLTSSDLEMAEESTIWPLPNNIQLVGIRFQGINIPRGANIVSSYIQFAADESDSDSCNLYIYGEKNIAPNEFNGSDSNISNRTKTVNNVNWIPPAWNSGDYGLSQQTPSLNNIITEIINQPGWQIGNSMAFIIDGYGKRIADSYDGDPAKAPELFITFNVSGTTHTESLIIDIPTFKIYPNPFQDVLNISWDNELEEIDVKVLDLSGKMVHHERKTNTNKLKLNLNQNLPKGQYFIKLTSNNFETIKKVIKL